MNIILEYRLLQAEYSKRLSTALHFLDSGKSFTAKDWAILQLDRPELFSALPRSLVLTFAQDKDEQGWLVNFNVLLKV